MGGEPRYFLPLVLRSHTQRETRMPTPALLYLNDLRSGLDTNTIRDPLPPGSSELPVYGLMQAAIAEASNPCPPLAIRFLCFQREACAPS